MHDLLAEINSPILDDIHRIGIVLAAGHGHAHPVRRPPRCYTKFGASQRPLRVARAVQEGLDSPNQVIVVGIKGRGRRPRSWPPTGASFRVPRKPGPRPDQPEPATPYASASKPSPQTATDRDVYIFLGDMGLLTGQVVAQFRASFESTDCDMMVLTGLYNGQAETNTYGRIVRVPATDASGQSAGTQTATKSLKSGSTKTSSALDAATPYEAAYNGRTYAFTRQELLETREINTGVVALQRTCGCARTSSISTPTMPKANCY